MNGRAIITMIIALRNAGTRIRPASRKTVAVSSSIGENDNVIDSRKVAVFKCVASIIPERGAPAAEGFVFAQGFTSDRGVEGWLRFHNDRVATMDTLAHVRVHRVV